MKKVLIDGVPKSNIPRLLYYATLASISAFSGAYAVTHLPLIEYALFFNTTPLFVALLSYIILKDKITPF